VAIDLGMTKFNFLRALVLGLTFTTAGLSAGETGRFLYVATPDGAQPDSKSGSGLLVFSIDDGHRFVRRIDVPSFGEGVRGLTGSPVSKCLYFGTTSRRMGCFDLETEKVRWEQSYEAGCDRSCVSADSKTIYAPTGWWIGKDAKNETGLLVIDAADGSLKRRIPVGPMAHNSLTSVDGKLFFLGTQNRLTIFNAKDESVLHTVDPVGEAGVFPFTVDHANKYAYVCLGLHVGFDVVEIGTGKVLHRVLAGTEPISHRTHGAALTPNEKELWISDQEGKRLFVFDATQMPPKEIAVVPLSTGGHGWVNFSLDGAYAYCHTPEVFDAKTRQRVAELKDENGKLVGSSKFIEVHLKDGKVVGMGSEFGLGRK
jgi:hypothetical protein